MNLKIDDSKFKYAQKAIICIAIGTAVGLFVYGIFLYFKIAIFGWNLGLIFAPLSAGYIETVLENKFLGKNLGAISAFILFVDTTIYSFILKNPTLGLNFITVGSIFVILQAAFPTVVNHIILVVLGGILSKVTRIFKKLGKIFKHYFDKRPIGYWESFNEEIKTNIVPFFDEMKSNNTLNNLDFFFLTSSDMKDRKHKVLKIYHSEIILEKNKTNVAPEKREDATLVQIKEGKDKCLIKIANEIKNDGGNGILDLSISYGVIGFGNDNIQIIATGMGIFIENV